MASVEGASGGENPGDNPALVVGGPSKNELKKLAKKKEKEEKAAKRAEEARQQAAAADASDTAKHLYGKLSDGVPKASDRKRTSLLDVSEGRAAEGEEILLFARVQNARVQSAKLAFLDLRHDSHNIQAVIAASAEVEPNISRQMVKFCGNLNRESTVEVTGVLRKPVEPVQSASISNLELHIKSCFVLGFGPEQLPMQLKDAIRSHGAKEEDEAAADASEAPTASMSVRLDNRVLDLRTPVVASIVAINSAITQLYLEFMFEHKFLAIQTPKIAGAATEGGSNVFEVSYFGRRAYLAQSPQFWKQMAIAGDLHRVCEIGPVFRAENSNTPRHLTEFTGLDFEMEFWDSWEEIIDMAEDVLVHIFNGLRGRFAHLIAEVQKQYPHAGDFRIPKGRAPRLRFEEGIQLLKEAGIDAPPDEDISTAHERKLGALVAEKYGTDFYFMTHYPSAARPFYTHPDPANPKVTRSYDAFMRGQEVISGAQRIHEPEMLIERMRSMDPPLDPESEGFKYYVDAFRMNCNQHGGGGFGLNRITMLWLGLENIREATMFPRDPQRTMP